MTDKIWSEALKELHGQMPQATFDQWFAGSQLKRVNGHHVVLATSSQARDNLKGHWDDRITRAVSRAAGQEVVIKFDAQEYQPVELESFDPEPAVKTEVIDKRTDPHYRIDNVFLQAGYGSAVGPPGIAIYNVLCMRGNETRDCYPSYAGMGRMAGCTGRTAIKKCQELAALGIIEIKARLNKDSGQTSNLFVLLSSSGWKDDPEKIIAQLRKKKQW